VKNHGELTGEEGKNPGEESYEDDTASLWQTPVGSLSSNSSSICYEYFGSTATLLRPRKKTKLEQLSSITIGYLATSKGRKDPNTWQRMRILLDSGCAATLINNYLVKT
jgi:hypothetical protein